MITNISDKKTTCCFIANVITDKSDKKITSVDYA